MYTRVGIAVLALSALGNQPAKPQAMNSFNGFALLAKSGNIRRPTGYRDLYQILGTYFVLDPKGGYQIHPERFQAFYEDNRWAFSLSDIMPCPMQHLPRKRR